MDRAGPVSGDGLQMLPGTVTLMPVKAIQGVFLMVADHGTVPEDLRYDGCGPYGLGDPVTFRQGPGVGIHEGCAGAVHQDHLRQIRKVPDGLHHGFQGGLQNVDTVNDMVFDARCMPGDSGGQDLVIKEISLRRGNSLAVHDRRERIVCGEDDRRGENGPREGPASRLVHPSDEGVSGFPELMVDGRERGEHGNNYPVIGDQCPVISKTEIVLMHGLPITDNILLFLILILLPDPCFLASQCPEVIKLAATYPAEPGDLDPVQFG